MQGKQAAAPRYPRQAARIGHVEGAFESSNDGGVVFQAPGSLLIGSALGRDPTLAFSSGSTAETGLVIP